MYGLVFVLNLIWVKILSWTCSCMTLGQHAVMKKWSSSFSEGMEIILVFAIRQRG